MRIFHFEKKLSIPPHSIDGSFVIAIPPADSGIFQVWKHYFLHRSWWYLKKIIKKCQLIFQNDFLIYCSTENVVHREVLRRKFWTFLHNSNYTCKQALNGGSFDWAYSKDGCECKLLQTLIKSLKICLKEFPVVIFTWL